MGWDQWEGRLVLHQDDDDGGRDNNNESELVPEARPLIPSHGHAVPSELRVMGAPALDLSPTGPASSHCRALVTPMGLLLGKGGQGLAGSEDGLAGS